MYDKNTAYDFNIKLNAQWSKLIKLPAHFMKCFKHIFVEFAKITNFLNFSHCRTWAVPNKVRVNKGR